MKKNKADLGSFLKRTDLKDIKSARGGGHVSTDAYIHFQLALDGNCQGNNLLNVCSKFISGAPCKVVPPDPGQAICNLHCDSTSC
ncbi:MAG: hypothetical protein QM528_02495 [Phycisphaerales bacterium]|nr:hypothetical protein [Phycisphaerales bacterium]